MADAPDLAPPPLPSAAPTPAGQRAAAVQASDRPAVSRALSDRPTLDRTTLERVLARAAELQTAAGDETASVDGLTEQQLLDIGGEVGLSGTHLRQALAEERTRAIVPLERGLVAQVAGAGTTSAQRTISSTPSQVLTALNQMMLRDECLAIKRRYDDRMTWEPRRDFWAAFRRLAPSAGRMYDLLRAREVGATVVAVDDGRTLVRLDADVSHTRAQRLQGGIAIAAGGLVTAGMIVGFFTMIVHAPVEPALIVGAVTGATGVVAGAAVARTHRHTVERAQLALEQILDRLEHSDARRPGSFLDVLTG